eukprot:PhM_4_TR2439/c0_g1_i3/m.78739
MVSCAVRDDALDVVIAVALGVHLARGAPTNDVSSITLLPGSDDALQSTSEGDEIICKFRGSLITSSAEDGAPSYAIRDVFECSTEGDESTLRRCTIGSEQVMPGWDLALQGARVGEVRAFVVPQQLGYEPNNDGAYLVAYVVDVTAVYPIETALRDS